MAFARISSDVLVQKSTGVEEDNLMPEHSVDAEDVLNRCHNVEVQDRRPEFLVHFTNDRIAVGLTEFDAAPNQAMVAIGVLTRGRIEGDSVGVQIGSLAR